MLYLLNNCHRYKHSEEYDDPNAFYDLELSGYKANFVFQEGVECVVATPDSHGNVDFVHFTFSHESTRTAKSGKKYRVLFGRKIDSKQLTKIDSAKTEPYKPLFDVNGNFKRRSVIQIDAKFLKTLIRKSLKRQGFVIQRDQIRLPDDVDKKTLRDLHGEAIRHKIEDSKRNLVKHEPLLLQRLASGAEIVPDKIYPELIEVQSGSKDELMFRYASLHWSIPVSSGYGRRLRFLVVDRHTEKLIGLFGLGDPVFSLGDRDQWVGWSKGDRIERLHHVVDAYVLGAVPPYSFLLGGKLIALLATSNEVREAFKCKYEGKASVIRKRKQPGEIALITTTSALGRSSLYNRLKFGERLAFERVGQTQGFGEFHFSNGIYDSIMEYAKSNTTATASHELWGKGFRNKQEVVRKTLAELELPRNWLNHGVKREIYVAPLADNTCDFLRGDTSNLNYYNQPLTELFDWFRERWLLARSESDQRYKEWEPQNWRLWGGGDNNE